MIPATGVQGEKPRSCRGKELILVVEDSRMIAHFLKRLLESQGFDVLVASDGLGGLEAARREQPSLVVTDFLMPRMHGLEMVKALRTDPLTHDIAILMLSGNDSADDKAQALAAGVDDYMVKGDPRQLVGRIKGLLARSR
jgi:DNA-binding response OmpR family regulator